MIILLLVTVGQAIICKFSLALLIAIIGRILFLLRARGVVIDFKISRNLEIAAIAVQIIGLIYSKHPNWVGIVSTIIGCGASIFLMYLDTKLYLYITEDEEK